MPMRVRPRVTLILAILSLGGTWAWSADLKQIQAEPNLEKRSKLALDNAFTVLQEARHAYRDGENEKAAALTVEVQASVELAYASLQQTNKDPRRSPRWFKSAEMATRDLLRKIESFQQDMSFADRPMLDKVKEKTQQVHDDLLLGLMEGKKK
jgi:biopolymer transport protein ExbB/TolQ